MCTVKSETEVDPAVSNDRQRTEHFNNLPGDRWHAAYWQNYHSFKKSQILQVYRLRSGTKGRFTEMDKVFGLFLIYLKFL